MSLPLVSILIPLCNTEVYLNECIESVCNQTYKNIHVILVADGASNLKSKDIREILRCKRVTFEYYQAKGFGVSVTRGELLTHIKGKYSLFVDSDDWIEPDMVENLVRYCEAEDLDFIDSNFYHERKDRAEIFESDNLEYNSFLKIYDRHKTLNEFLNFGDIKASLCTKLIKNEILSQLSFEKDINYAEDLLLSWRLLKHVNKVGSINDAYYHYRSNPVSITHQKFNRGHLALDRVWSIILSDTKESYPDFHDIASINKLTADIWLLYYAFRSGEQDDTIIKTLVNKIRDGLKSVKDKSQIQKKKLVFGILATKFNSPFRWIIPILNPVK